MRLWKKFVSVIVMATLVIQLLPAQFLIALSAPENESVPAENTESADNTGKVVEEIITSRDEYQKEFMLDNGQRMLVVFPVAVHYQEDGEWKEIDNTLKPQGTGDETVYQNNAGIWEVRLPEKLDASSAVEVEKDGYILKFELDGSLSSTDNIEASDTENSTESFDTPQSDSATADGSTIPDSSTAAPLLDDAEVVQVNESVFAMSQTNSATATVTNDTFTFQQEDKILESVVTEGLNTTVEYSSVLDSTDLRYDLISNRLKESIIINSSDVPSEGYRFNIEAENLLLELQEDNSINAYASGGGSEPVFHMPAPYMVDNAGEHTNDIDVILEEAPGGYTLTYLLPQEWLERDNIAYPVVLDPVIQPETSITNIHDQTISEFRTLDDNWGMVEVGWYPSYGAERAVAKYINLPSLTSADVIVQASYSMYKLYDSVTTTQVNVHKMTDTWESGTITWANQPAYNPNIEDFQIVKNAGWYTWDITDIVRKWYDGDNTGMMFKSPDSVEQAGNEEWKQFCSSDFSTSTLPVMYMTYINNNGIESYWDYTSHSAGRAGTGSVNNYTGNLVWVHDDLGFAGNRMPVSISHVYNANDRHLNFFGLGYGWRTNYNQLVYYWSVDSSYMIWEDEDGTKHYFKYESDGVYKDETDNGLTLTNTGSGATKFCIQDKDGNKSYFDENCRLTKIENNQATKSNITITYFDAASTPISTITDGAGRVYSFQYSNGLLSKIAFNGTGSSEISALTFSYSNNELTGITYPDGKSVSYSYADSHLLNSASDINGYTIQYGYNTLSTSQPNRITSISASENSVDAGTLSIEYAHNQTTFVDHNGNKQIMQFNNIGNTVSIQDGQGRAQFAEYAQNNDTTARANQLTLSSKLQNTVSNMLKNSSFETSGYWTLDVGSSYSTAEKYLGSRSLCVQKASSGMGRASSESITLLPGYTYTFSAYVKTSDMDGTGSGAMLVIMGSSLFSTSTAVNSNNDWQRIELTYTRPETAASVSANFFLCNFSAGKAYFDCVQLEVSPTASRYNIIENGDFTYGTNGWTGYNTTASDINTSVDFGSAAPQLDSNVLTITGDGRTAKRYFQNVNAAGDAGDVYTLAGWAKGDSVPYVTDDRRFALIAQFTYTDGTDDIQMVQFNPDTDSNVSWQYAATRLVAKKAYSGIQIIISYENNANTVYFDGIQLYKEEFGHSYVYDSDGNIISVTDLQHKTTQYEYSNNNLTLCQISHMTHMATTQRLRLEAALRQYPPVQHTHRTATSSPLSPTPRAI